MQPENPIRQGKINKTIFYRIAFARAKKYLANPQQLRGLATKLKNKIQRQTVYEAVAEVWEFIHCFLRLVNAYVRGQYRDLPLQSLLLIIACLVYFGMVADLIPDFLAGIGLIDDIALIKWTWDAVKDDIAVFRDWERQNNLAGASASGVSSAEASTVEKNKTETNKTETNVTQTNNKNIRARD